MGAKHLTMQLTIKQGSDETKREPVIITVAGEGKAMITEIKGKLYPGELLLVNDLVQRLKSGNDKPKEKKPWVEPDGNRQEKPDG